MIDFTDAGTSDTQAVKFNAGLLQWTHWHRLGTIWVLIKEWSSIGKDNFIFQCTLLSIKGQQIDVRIHELSSMLPYVKRPSHRRQFVDPEATIAYIKCVSSFSL
jgi:hypothetical protein